MQHMSSNPRIKGRASNTPPLLSSAEFKLFVVFVYYLFSGALQLTTFSISTRNIAHNVSAITTYINCQRSGKNSSCSLELKQNRFWSLFALIVILLFPVINLFFVLKLSYFKRLCMAGGKRVTLLRRSTRISFFSSSS